jgi:hypothetical protein
VEIGRQLPFNYEQLVFLIVHHVLSIMPSTALSVNLLDTRLSSPNRNRLVLLNIDLYVMDEFPYNLKKILIQK